MSSKRKLQHTESGRTRILTSFQESVAIWMYASRWYHHIMYSTSQLYILCMAYDCTRYQEAVI